MPRTVIIGGYSVSWGYGSGRHNTVVQTLNHPGACLAYLLKQVPTTNPWRNATVINYAVPNATTHNWVVGPPWGILTNCQGKGIPLIDYAVPRAISLLQAYQALKPSVVNAVLWLEGIADKWPFNNIPTAATVANVQTIKSAFAPAPVLVSRPVPYITPPFDVWSKEIGDAMVAAGLVNGPYLPLCGNWPKNSPATPTASETADPLHFDDRGCLQLAGFYRDALSLLP